MTESTATKLKPISAVVCEDIRREGNGKAMLIGVFAENIVIPAAPANIQLALWIIADVQAVGSESKCHFKLVQTSNDKTLAEIEGKIGASKLVQVSFSVGPFPITCDEGGPIELLFEESGGKWVSIAKKNLVVTSINPSSEQPQLS